MRTGMTRKITCAILLFGMTVLAVMAAAEDPVWPRQITRPGGKLVVYQPQVDDWKDFQQVDGRMAFTITPTGGKTHVGVVTVQLQSAVNMDAHTVLLSDPKITNVSFPSLDPATTTQMEQLVRTFLNPAATMTISLDRLVASVKKKKSTDGGARKERSADHLHQHATGDPAYGEWRTRKCGHRELESAVRRECQLAVVHRGGQLHLLSVRRQRAGSSLTAWRGHGRPPASCPSRCRRCRRTRISPT